jgi:hypothetical protein
MNSIIKLIGCSHIRHARMQTFYSKISGIPPVYIEEPHMSINRGYSAGTSSHYCRLEVSGYLRTACKDDQT